MRGKVARTNRRDKGGHKLLLGHLLWLAQDVAKQGLGPRRSGRRGKGRRLRHRGKSENGKGQEGAKGIAAGT